MLSRPLFADQLESPRTGQFSSGSDRQTKQGERLCLRRIYRLHRWFTSGQVELLTEPPWPCQHARYRSTTGLTRLSFVDADVPAHPFDILKVINGFLLFFVTGHIHKAKAALASCLSIQRKAALFHSSVFRKKTVQIFLLAIPGQIADVDSQKRP